MTLPSTPLDTAAPAWSGYSDAPGSAVSLPPGTRVSLLQPPLITGDQLTAHLAREDAWRSLPDGRPLRLCADALEYIVDDFGGYQAASLRSAHRVLWFATRTPEQMDALWVPAPLPAAEDRERDALPPEGLAFRLRDLQQEISRWARQTFAPDTALQVRNLAWRLWSHVVDRLPVPAEKKSPAPETPGPDSASPGSVRSAGSSPEDAPSATIGSAPQTSSESPTPSSAGPTNTDTPSSPVPKSAASSPPPEHS